MKQTSLYDEENAYQRISKLGDKLEWLDKVINWKIFVNVLNTMKPDKTKEGKGGRPPYDNLMMFKVIILQQLYNLSDEQAEYQINDRLSWKRFLAMTAFDRAPDSTTIWEFRERLTNSGCYERLFKLFNKKMEEIGVITRSGSIVDAAFEEAPRQRNSRNENKQIKDHKIPEEWEGNEHKLAQKDMEATWTKKNGETHFGYKNHIKSDKDSKLITDCLVTTASVHDSQAICSLIDQNDQELWADSGYTGEEYETKIKEICPTIRLHICEKGYRNHPLTEEQKANNREKSRIRCRVEHIFGHMANSMGGMTIRSIGLMRAEGGLVLKNLAYNITRYASLRKNKSTPSMAQI